MKLRFMKAVVAAPVAAIAVSSCLLISCQGRKNGQHGTDRRHRRDKPENIRRYSPAGYIRNRRPVLRGQS